MGKKLNALLGRYKKKPPTLKTLATLATSRITILKNLHQVRCSHARSDIVQLLNLGHHETALLRVEHVIREQNMLDALEMIENYCHLLTECVVLVENSRECPDELTEAISSLIFAASRCGELPELQEIRWIFTSRYGKDFATRAVELRNNCKVNPKIVQKLSTRQASLESRKKLLKQIASDNSITLRLEDDVYVTAGENQDIYQNKKQLKRCEASNLSDPDIGVDGQHFPDVMEQDKFSESVRSRNKYRDVADAARDAFESAAYAAAAARAAVELSRAESWDEDTNNHRRGSNQKQESAISRRSSKSKLSLNRNVDSEDIRPSKQEALDKIHRIDGLFSKSEQEDMAENSKISYRKEQERNNNTATIDRTLSSSSSDTDADNPSDGKVTSDLEANACQMPLNPHGHPARYSPEGRFILGKTHLIDEEDLHSRHSHTESKQTSITRRPVHRD
ncbi:hypothetical protein NMG60_11006198 [Bertholletia excelsa]